MMRWLAKLNLRKRPLSGNEPVELSYFLSGTGVLEAVCKDSLAPLRERLDKLDIVFAQCPC
jgi:hypothetical protein